MLYSRINLQVLLIFLSRQKTSDLVMKGVPLRLLPAIKTMPFLQSEPMLALNSARLHPTRTSNAMNISKLKLSHLPHSMRTMFYPAKSNATTLRSTAVPIARRAASNSYRC